MVVRGQRPARAQRDKSLATGLGQAAAQEVRTRPIRRQQAAQAARGAVCHTARYARAAVVQAARQAQMAQQARRALLMAQARGFLVAVAVVVVARQQAQGETVVRAVLRVAVAAAARRPLTDSCRARVVRVAMVLCLSSAMCMRRGNDD